MADGCSDCRRNDRTKAAIVASFGAATLASVLGAPFWLSMIAAGGSAILSWIASDGAQAEG